MMPPQDSPPVLPTWAVMLIMVAFAIVLSAVLNLIESDPGTDWRSPTTTATTTPLKGTP